MKHQGKNNKRASNHQGNTKETQRKYQGNIKEMSMKYRRVEGESTTRVNTDQLQVADKEKYL